MNKYSLALISSLVFATPQTFFAEEYKENKIEKEGIYESEAIEKITKDLLKVVNDKKSKKGRGDHLFLHNGTTFYVFYSYHYDYTMIGFSKITIDISILCRTFDEVYESSKQTIKLSSYKGITRDLNKKINEKVQLGSMELANKIHQDQELRAHQKQEEQERLNELARQEQEHKEKAAKEVKTLELQKKPEKTNSVQPSTDINPSTKNNEENEEIKNNPLKIICKYISITTIFDRFKKQAISEAKSFILSQYSIHQKYKKSLNDAEKSLANEGTILQEEW